MSNFNADDFRHTAELLRSDNDAIIRATLSNNYNIILAALDRCYRPNWEEIYKDAVHTPDRDSDPVVVTRETARLARSALQEQNARDYYHNYGAAQDELSRVLALSGGQGSTAA